MTISSFFQQCLWRLNPSVTDAKITLEDALDCFACLKQYLPQLEAAISTGSRDQRKKDVLALFDAVARGKLAPSIADRLDANVSANLDATGELAPRVLRFARELVKRSKDWEFVDEAAIAHLPSLKSKELQKFRVSQEDMASVRMLAYSHFPPSALDLTGITSLRQRMLEGTAEVEPWAQPYAIVMVGAPGSGKGGVIAGDLAVQLKSFMGSPFCSSSLVKSCAIIDPDAVVGIFNNDNTLRPLADMINHENFLITVKMRRHIIFDGTGKGPLNTCGRVIGRLSEAGYKVVFCIVASSFNTCLDRIENRAAITGRKVPRQFVESACTALASSVPAYLDNLSSLAKMALIYDGDTTPSTLQYCIRPRDSPARLAEAKAFVRQRFRIHN